MLVVLYTKQKNRFLPKVHREQKTTSPTNKAAFMFVAFSPQHNAMYWNFRATPCLRNEDIEIFHDIYDVKQGRVGELLKTVCYFPNFPNFSLKNVPKCVTILLYYFFNELKWYNFAEICFIVEYNISIVTPRLQVLPLPTEQEKPFHWRHRAMRCWVT